MYKRQVPKHEYDFSKTKVGDKITVDLKELGKFEATAYEVTDNDVLFIFDDYIAERPMNCLLYTSCPEEFNICIKE